ncbi:hypothetical protein Tco_1203920 [Tanacetum coccineum]
MTAFLKASRRIRGVGFVLSDIDGVNRLILEFVFDWYWIDIGIEWFQLSGYVGYIWLVSSGLAWLCIRYCLVLSRWSGWFCNLDLMSEYAVESEYVVESAVCLNLLSVRICCCLPVMLSFISVFMYSVLCTCLNLLVLSACSALVYLRICVILCYAPV